MWRVILSLTALLAAIIGAMSFLSYLWASHAAPTVPPVVKSRESVSNEEIQSVLDYYKKKQERLDSLLKQRPTPPSLGGATGLDSYESTTLESAPEVPNLDGPQP